MPPAKGVFDEEFTPEEEAALNDTAAVPPAEEEGEGSVEEAVAAAAQPAEAPKPGDAAEPKPGDPAAAPASAAAPETEASAEDRAWAEFLEKNKDKSPEELAKLAFQQSRRANRSEQQNRQVRDRVSALAERAQRTQEARQQAHASLPELKAKFREKVATDPDAAVTELFDGLIESQVQNLDVQAHEARIDEAIQFAETRIPEFGKSWPEMHDVLREVGYSDEELNAIDDGRPLIVAYLASLSGRLMKAGLMDGRGNLVNVPQMLAQPLDPRLAAPEPQRTLAGGGSRSARGAQTIEQQLNEIANMTDEQLNKFEQENPGAIDSLLQQAA